MRPTSIRPRKWWVTTVTITALLAVSACGVPGGSDDVSDGTPSLTLAVINTSASTSTAYYAEAIGEYEAHGVNVEFMDNTGNNSLNFVASGQADVGLVPSTTPVVLAGSNKDAVIVSGYNGKASGGLMVGGEGYPSIESLRGQRIATLGKGTSPYGYAHQYSDDFGLGATIVPMDTGASVANAVRSGQVQGAVGPYAAFSQLLDAGTVNMLVDTRDPQIRAEIVGPDIAEGVYVGRADIMERKSEAVERFLAANLAAQERMNEASPRDVAQTLRQFDAFKVVPEEALAGQVENALPYLTGPEIDEAMWNRCLEQFTLWGLSNYDPSDPAYAYGRMVNMSYLNASDQ